MTDKSPSAVNHRFNFEAGVNYASKAQALLFSYGNGALFIGGQKATPMQLVKPVAMGLTYLSDELLQAVNRGSFGYAQRVAEQLSQLTEQARVLRIERDVRQTIAYNTKS